MNSNADTTTEEMLEWDNEGTDSIDPPVWMGIATLFLFLLFAIILVLSFLL